MKSCRLIIHVLIFLLIEYSGCFDKPTDKPDNLHTDHTSSCDNDNIEVTETNEQSCHEPVKDPITQPYPQPQQPHPEQSTPQDEKHYLLGSQPRKDGRLNLVPITHLEYIPPQAEQQPTEQPNQRQYYPTQPGYQNGPYPGYQPQQYYPGYGHYQTQGYEQYPQPQPQYSGYQPQPVPPYYPAPPVSIPVQQYPIPQPPEPLQQPLYQPHGYEPGYSPYQPYQPQHPLPTNIQYQPQSIPIPQPSQPIQPQPGYQPSQQQPVQQPQPQPGYQPTLGPQYYPGVQYPGYQPYQPYIPQPPQPVPGYYLPYQPTPGPQYYPHPGYQLQPYQPIQPTQGPYEGPTQPVQHPQQYQPSHPYGPYQPQPPPHPQPPQPYPQTGYQLQQPYEPQPPYQGPTHPLPTTIQTQYQPTQQPYQPRQPSQVTQATPHPLTQPRQPIGSQPYPRATGPLRQPSNLGPGILGPAPGPLRDPSEIIKEYDQLADKLTTAAKDEEYKKQPTKEPQQEPSTQHAQEPTGLHPETITVEVGSDEEEEPPKEPPGPPKKPGDGDKPEEGDDDGDDDDEDKYDKKKPFKENKKRCQSIKFYKKDKNGLPVEFNLFDYDIQWNDIFLTIYNFLISPFIIECDGMVVWERTNKNFKPKSMTYNKKHNTFVIRVRCHFLLQKLVNGKWQEYIFDIPKYVNLYREDTEGNIVPMTEGDYEIVRDNEDAVKYTFTPTLEELHCDGEIVYKHISRNRKTSSLIYNRIRHHFLLKNDLGMYVCNYRKGVWSVFNHKFLHLIYIFTKDAYGNDMFLTSEHYTNDIGDRGSFKYIFKDGVKCTKIMYRNQLVWEKTDHTDNYPIHFYISLKYHFYILFSDHIYKYSKRGTEYHHFSDNLRRQKK